MYNFSLDKPLAPFSINKYSKNHLLLVDDISPFSSTRHWLRAFAPYFDGYILLSTDAFFGKYLPFKAQATRFTEGLHSSLSAEKISHIHFGEGIRFLDMLTKHRLVNLRSTYQNARVTVFYKNFAFSPTLANLAEDFSDIYVTQEEMTKNRKSQLISNVHHMPQPVPYLSPKDLATYHYKYNYKKSVSAVEHVILDNTPRIRAGVFIGHNHLRDRAEFIKMVSTIMKNYGMSLNVYGMGWKKSYLGDNVNIFPAVSYRDIPFVMRRHLFVLDDPHMEYCKHISLTRSCLKLRSAPPFTPTLCASRCKSYAPNKTWFNDIPLLAMSSKTPLITPMRELQHKYFPSNFYFGYEKGKDISSHLVRNKEIMFDYDQIKNYIEFLASLSDDDPLGESKAYLEEQINISKRVVDSFSIEAAAKLIAKK